MSDCSRKPLTRINGTILLDGDILAVETKHEKKLKELLAAKKRRKAFECVFHGWCPIGPDALEDLFEIECRSFDQVAKCDFVRNVRHASASRFAKNSRQNSGPGI